MHILRLFGCAAELAVVIALAAPVATIAAPAAAAAGGVLDEPALVQRQPSASLMVAVTAAGSRLVAVGDRGVILLSDDDGVTWRQARVPVSVTLTAVHFASPSEGWAAGHFGVVLHTSDGGETWHKQLDGRAAAQAVLQQAEAAAQAAPNDENAAAALSAARLLVEDGPDKPFFDFHFQDAKTGFVVGAYGLAFRTVDGGRSWQPWQDRIDNPQGAHLYAIRAVGDTLYLAGEMGYFARSRDGARFTALELPYQGTLFGFQAGPSGQILVFGLRGNALWSGDGGDSWQEVETGTVATLNGAARLKDGSVAVVSDRGEILKSRNGLREVQRFALPAAWPYSGLVEAADGGLVVTGTQGVARLPADLFAQSTVGESK